MNKTNPNIDDLADYVFEALQKSSKLYYQPKHQTLRKLFNCPYFASMSSEEGELINVRVAFYNPSEPDFVRRVKTDRWNFVPFDNPRIFDLKTVVKLSKSVDPWCGHWRFSRMRMRNYKFMVSSIRLFTLKVFSTGKLRQNPIRQDCFRFQ